MASISVYEPPGCCSSGVCGPEVEEPMIRRAVIAEQPRFVDDVGAIAA